MKLNSEIAHEFNGKNLTNALIEAKLSNLNLAKKIAEGEGKGNDKELIHSYSVYIGRMQGVGGGKKRIDGDFLDLIQKALDKTNIKGKFVPSIKKANLAKKKKENKQLLTTVQAVFDPKDLKGYFAKLRKAFLS